MAILSFLAVKKKKKEMQSLIFPGKQVAAFGGKGVAQGPTEVIMRVGKKGWDVVESPE